MALPVDPREVAVVGAGIGGLAVAAALLRRGIRVTVFEQSPELGEVGAGVMLTPNASRCLADFGILDEVAAEAVTPEWTRVRHGHTGEILSEAPVGDEYRGRFGVPFLCVHRADLHGALLRLVARLDPGCIRVGHRLVRIVEQRDKVVLQFEGGVEFVADATIGCDGIRSIVRGQLGFQESARFTGNVAWRGLVPADSLALVDPANTMTIWASPTAHITEYSIRGGRLRNYVASAERSGWEIESWRIQVPSTEALAEFADWHPAVRELLGNTPEGGCFKWALFDRDPMERAASGRVALLGDAAHPMLPFMAQGAAMAIEDAIVLGRCWSGDASVNDAFARYSTARMPRTTWAQLRSRHAQHIYRGNRGPAIDADREERMATLYGYNALSVEI
jgi:salicylate hydroxylase